MIRFLIGCNHSRLSFPQTAVTRGIKGATSICCLDCGTRFAYSWERMRIGAAIREEAPKTWQTAASPEAI